MHPYKRPNKSTLSTADTSVRHGRSDRPVSGSELGIARQLRSKSEMRRRTGSNAGHAFGPPDVLSILAVLIGAVVWLWLRSAGYRSDWLQLVAISAIALVLVLMGARRSQALLGRLDFFHPLVFPLIYVAVSFLAPVWATFVSGYAVGSLSRDNSVAANTPFLLCLGVAGFAAGAAMHFPVPRGPAGHRMDRVAYSQFDRKRGARKSTNRVRRRGSEGSEASVCDTSVNLPRDGDRVGPTRNRVLGGTMLICGRLLIFGTLTIVFYQLARGGVLARGLNQTEYDLNDTFAVLTKLLPLTALVLICSGSALLGHAKVLTRFDLVLLGLVVAGIGVRGTRNTEVAVILMLLFIYTRRVATVRWRVVVLGLMAAVALMLVVLRYRNSALGIQSDRAWWAGLLGDLAPAAFSVGVVASLVPSSVPYAYGSTVLAAVVRQLPGPLAVAVFGDPTNTGARIFRDMVGANNDNAGVGFSIPAEGYLNFGVAGLVAFCFLMGLGLSWSYSRVDLGSGKVTRMVYPILIGVLPMALRSDLLGAMKLALYPALLMLAVVLLGRSLNPAVRAMSGRVDASRLGRSKAGRAGRSMLVARPSRASLGGDRAAGVSTDADDFSSDSGSLRREVGTIQTQNPGS